MTILYRSYETALAARKAYADAVAGRGATEELSWLGAMPLDSGGTLGCEITTPEALLADEWELWGDGRAIVTPQERELVLAMLLNDHEHFPSATASVRLFARFVGYQAGVDRFESIVACEEKERTARFGLEEAESAAFSLVAAYHERLEERGLIEAGCAAALLGEKGSDGRLVVAERLAVPPALRRWIASHGARSLEEDGCIIEADLRQRSSFAFPAGPGAVRGAVRDLIAEVAGEGATIAIGASDPAGLFAEAAPALVAAGWKVGLEVSVTFRQTAIGRALEAAADLLEGGAHGAQDATDIASGSFSAMGRAEAQRLDGRLRGDRSLDPETMAALLREASPAFVALEELLKDGSSDGVAAGEALCQALDGASGLSSGVRCAEEKMLDAYLALRRRALALGADLSIVREQARSLCVTLSLASGDHDGEGPTVRILDASRLAAAAPRSFDGVILEGLTDAMVSAASSRSTLEALGEKVGLPAPPTRTEELRCGFEAARRAARSTFACVMPLRDEAFEPTYPAFTLEEYVSAYGEAQGWDAAEKDEDMFLFPKALTEGALRPGEDDLVAAVGAVDAAPVRVEELAGVTRGRLGHTILLDRLKTVTAAEGVLPILSPSAIENYLGCPYRWFVTGRLRTHELDETFSAREKGLFAHRAYGELYERLAVEGIRHLDASGLDHARQLLGVVMDDILAEYEASRGPSSDEGRRSDRLMAISAQERVEVERLCEELRDSLELLAQLPAGYEVAAHELAIVAEDGVDFGGARLNGRLDRIDVAPESGRFVVVDYKGSLTGHGAGFSEKEEVERYELPSKVQALIYARAFERHRPGSKAAAAVYASYRAAKGGALLAGSFDPAAYDVSGLASRACAVHRDFDSFLTLVEERIARAIDALKGGAIAPIPRDGLTCSYCPLICCEGRR